MVNNKHFVHYPVMGNMDFRKEVSLLMQVRNSVLTIDMLGIDEGLTGTNVIPEIYNYFTSYSSSQFNASWHRPLPEDCRRSSMKIVRSNMSTKGSEPSMHDTPVMMVSHWPFTISKAGGFALRPGEIPWWTLKIVGAT
ncbi:uncharacterized protein STEHIDRAFT_113961 [Stereum hirsutum FP-91666 SS1]|uniref:uncharacterized protein n=1 Tax=Stereum hirsutum (strain FP-91666) TaxID=721885 RepID=UPI000444A056|nr:uncharacterized protein STEHIDRAFT_113961 [Stereum hirsutum FP-91666 SS1]EIM82877.1 hypothetical protein STEHIDRAFT_113961 [Stereum hirsutum FP-91666 SS1]